MKYTTSFAAVGARVVTSVAFVVAATFLFACADDSTPTSPSPASTAAGASAIRIPGGSEKRIVFASDRANYGTSWAFDIYSMLPDGSGLTRLTLAYDNLYPALSPDGKRVVFVSNRDNPLYDIYVMNSDGSNVKRLTVTAAANDKPTWSADGTKILFTSTRNAADPNARDVGASWEVYVMNADGSGQTRVTSNNVGEWDPQLSPDGAHIVFASDRDHPESSWNRDVYTMNTDGTNIHRLTSQDGTAESPRYDPAGARIAYDVMNGSAPGIYVLSGRTLTRIAADAGTLELSPAWSPDGKQIAYTHFVTGNNSYSNIYKMNADGSSPKALTREHYYVTSPDWGR